MNIHAVQFVLQSRDAIGYGFSRHVEEFYKKTLPGDVIIFPEEIGLMSLVQRFSSTNLEDILEKVVQMPQSNYGDSGGKTVYDRSVVSYFAEYTFSHFHELFSHLSNKYSVYTVSCNNDSNLPFSKSILPSGQDKVYNVAYVFSPEGARIFKQTKVNLTGTEKTIGLAAGSYNDIKLLKINNIKLGIAISLDAFVPQYISRLEGADIIIQPDANNENWLSYLGNGRWQPDEWMDSAYYIAQRLSGVKYVFNPMLNADLGTLRFEGQSAITKKGGSDDEKKSYLGNLPVVGFAELSEAFSYDPQNLVSRDELAGKKLEIKEKLLSLEIKD